MARIAHNIKNTPTEPRPIEYDSYDYPEQDPDAPCWPSEGKIEFSHVRMAYSPDVEPIFKDLSFVIEPGSKVGIVGRTGSGKSTLIMCLFRLAELCGIFTPPAPDNKLSPKMCSY